MKKSLIALAALAAVTAASAQSTVTVSGGLVLAVGTSKLDAQSSKTEIRRQTGNLAFKGSEDLGGGLKANFEVQTSIGADADTANGANPTVLGDRGLYINLTGAFGAVQAGKAATATRAIFGAMGDVSRLAVVTGLSASSSSAATSVLGQPGDTGSFVTANNATTTNTTSLLLTNPSYLASTGVLDAGDARARVIYGDFYAKYVAYQTPTISGFTGSIGIVPTRSNDADTFNNAPQKSYGVTYANGPLGVAYNLVDAPTATGGTGTVTGAYKQHTAVASYDFGVVKVGVTSQMIKLASGVNPSNGLSLTANAPITGAGSIGFGYGKRGASTSADTRFGDDVKQTFIGYRHELSKRTNLQLVMNKIDRQGSTKTNDLTETHVMFAHAF